MSLMENSAPGSTKGECAEKKHPSPGSFLSPLTLYPQDTQFLEHQSAEGAVICQWGSLRTEAGVGK